MRGLILIAATGLILNGCASVKIRENVTEPSEKRSSLSVKDLAGNNLSDLSFNFSKIEISIEGTEGKQKLIGNVKYEYPGRFLISLRNSTGLEGARIYLDRDTILANDRINRKLYYGSSKQLHDKYGITSDYIPVLIGDFISGIKTGMDEVKCLNGNTELNIFTGLNKIVFVADCAREKIIKATFTEGENKMRVEAVFSHFGRLNNRLYPKVIHIDDFYGGNKIDIEIRKAEIINGQEIKFIPGNNYELILIR